MGSDLSESKDVYQMMEQYIVIRASLKNKLDGLKSKKATNYLIKSIDNQIDKLTIAIYELENKVIELVKKIIPRYRAT